MNALAKITIAAAAISALCLVPACSSDPNPVDYLNVKGSKANVQINFKVAATRADEENAISKVSLYVFNADGILEHTSEELDASSGSVNIETTPGRKTIYAVSAKQIVAPNEKTTLDAFEATIFDSPLSILKSSDGFVMLGKKTDVIVEKSVSQATKCEIAMTRTLAKALVSYSAQDDVIRADYAALGFSQLSEPYFKVMQSCTSMRILSNGEDVIKTDNTDETNGTYPGYENPYIEWAQGASTVNSGVAQYMAENIVSKPTSGNTTFLTLRLKSRPAKWYSYSAYENKLDPRTPSSTLTDPTYYAIALVDEASGYIDYAVNTEDSNKILFFYDASEAEDYITDAGNGKVKLKFAADVKSSAAAPSMKKAGDIFGSIKVLTFTNGYVYYRINIEETKGEEKKAMVKRNTFYTLNVRSIKKLGAPSESYLIPTNPATNLNFTPEAGSWLDTSFKVESWTADDSDVNL